MSAASCLLSEDEVKCPICLDLLSDPVSTPCGHNFCKICLKRHWDTSLECNCPFCKEIFSSRPQLKTNTFISAMVTQFRQKAEESPRAEENQREHMCPQHHKPLELFCETDNSCVCVHCSLQHQGHALLSLKEAFKAKQSELQESQDHTHRSILERREKIKDIQQSLELSQTAADYEISEAVQLFSALIELLQRHLDQVLQEIQEKQNEAKIQTEAQIQALEQEITELNRRCFEVEQLRSSDNYVNVLKNSSSLTPAPLSTIIRFKRPSFLRTVEETAHKVKKIFKEHLEMLLAEEEMQKIQKSAMNVTLDPDTAHSDLSLSENLKQVTYTGVKRKLSQSPKRITGYCGVLGRQSISSGRFYFEVQVSGSKKWIVGVAKESINRKDKILATTVNGFWTIARYNSEYNTDDPDYKCLQVKTALKTVGVFVDYEEGEPCQHELIVCDLCSAALEKVKDVKAEAPRSQTASTFPSAAVIIKTAALSHPLKEHLWICSSHNTTDVITFERRRYERGSGDEKREKSERERRGRGRKRRRDRERGCQRDREQKRKRGRERERERRVRGRERKKRGKREKER
ncbi:hypothetical protein WMY93_021581 [Mugilogobius chulae]|uniref:Uncharacterized protein n=1 Tax=Mugilogobius chulae TaxID=88201 RepID=A0AAW0NFE6_9GOBI